MLFRSWEQNLETRETQVEIVPPPCHLCDPRQMPGCVQSPVPRICRGDDSSICPRMKRGPFGSLTPRKLEWLAAVTSRTVICIFIHHRIWGSVELQRTLRNHCRESLAMLKPGSWVLYPWLQLRWTVGPLSKKLFALWVGWERQAERSRPVGVFSRGTTRISGSLTCGAREVRSPCVGKGERVMALESW